MTTHLLFRCMCSIDTKSIWDVDVVTQFKEYGFINIDMINNGAITFDANDGTIKDQFSITKSK
jgi:hypothetical protein